jgi:uncharacterized membrane protein
MNIPPIVNKVRGALILENLLMKHGDVRFRITPDLKEGGELVNGSHWKKDMVKMPAKNKNILIPKYSSCSTLGTQSRGIMVEVKEGSEWQTCRALI